MNARDWLRNTRGEWYVAIQAALMLLIASAPLLEARRLDVAPKSDFVIASSAALFIVGATFVILGSAGLGRNLSPFPKPRDSSSLIETGIFSIVRHPIYTGLSLCALGWSLMWVSLSAFALSLALIALFDVKARREENWLSAKFSSYAAYRARVKKLIPFVY